MLDILKDYLARRDPKRLSLRLLIVALAGLLATPEGQAMLAAALGQYAWAAPIIALLLAGITNGKGKEDAPSS